jgi:hypothetical protein
MTLAQLAASVTDADEGVLIYPTKDGEWATRYLGLTPEQAASILYQMADAIVDQKIPPPDWRQRIKGG